MSFCPGKIFARSRRDDEEDGGGDGGGEGDAELFLQHRSIHLTTPPDPTLAPECSPPIDSHFFIAFVRLKPTPE